MLGHFSEITETSMFPCLSHKITRNTVFSYRLWNTCLYILLHSDFLFFLYFFYSSCLDSYYIRSVFYSHYNYLSMKHCDSARELNLDYVYPKVDLLLKNRF